MVKLSDFVKNGRTLLGTRAFRLPESEQNTGQDAPEPLTPEQTAEALAKRGILMRNPPASTLGVGRRSS